MRGLGDFAGLDFFEGVEALAGCGEGVHEMHAMERLAIGPYYAEISVYILSGGC